MKKLSLYLLGLLALWACTSPPPVQAECRVLTSPETYTAGQVVRDVCDIHGTRLTSNVDSTGAVVGSPGGLANAAAPTLVEGTYYGFSLDLAGNTRTTLGTLLSGEDQTNNLIQTSGGAVRLTTMWSAMTTDTTSAVNTAPTGTKYFYASVDGTGAVTQTHKIYGGISSGMTATNGVLLCTLTLSGTTHDHAGCTVKTSWPFFIDVTSLTTGTSATGAVTVMY